MVSTRTLFAILISFAVAGGLVYRARTVSKSTRELGIRGLENADLDGWTRGLSGPADSAPNPDGGAEGVIAVFESIAQNASNFDAIAKFSAALGKKFARGYPTSADYLRLAENLARAQDQIRLRGPEDFVRKATLLLTLYGEEALAVAARKFRDLPRVWIVAGDAMTRECAVGKGADVLGLRFCAGDTFISKGEDFSSALNLFRIPLAAAYSHSAFIAPDSRGALRLLEAEGFGGSFSRLSEGDSPARASLYRARPASDPGAKALRSAVGRAEKLTRGKDEAPDNSVFGFNFRIAPECRDGFYFCTELNYCIFRDVGIEDTRNPFPRSLWAEPPEEKGGFLDRVWRGYSGAIPSPSDIERNPGYELVAHRLVLAEIPRLRVQFVALNAFMTVLAEEPSRRDAYANAFLELGETTLASASPAEAARVLRLGSLQPKIWPSLKAYLPGSIRIREIAFYYHIQDRVLPEIEKVLLRADAAAPTPVPLGEFGALALPLIRAEIDVFVSRARELTKAL